MPRKTGSVCVPQWELAPGYSVPRLILGLWQLSGGHGRVDEKQAQNDLLALVKSGFTAFDCADIYTGVEELLGRFLKSYRPLLRDESPQPVQIHTKYVPDLNALAGLKQIYTETVIDRSLAQLGLERLDLVQFHWWDFNIPGHVEAALHLKALQAAGKILHLGVTNYDAEHLRELLEAGVSVVSNQVQYSVLDRRPEKELTELAQEYGFSLLCYGTLAGGFLSERYLGETAPGEPLENRSLTKYRLIIEEFGGWEAYQDLLQVLNSIAQHRGVGIAELAGRFILDKPAVGSIIIGIRNSVHLPKLMNIAHLKLTPQERQEISSALLRAKGPMGPVFGLERKFDGRHGRIMKYDLNKVEIT